MLKIIVHTSPIITASFGSIPFKADLKNAAFGLPTSSALH